MTDKSSEPEAFNVQEHNVKPIFAAQKAEARVIQLQAGCPAQYSIPTPNPENENSAILISYQASFLTWKKKPNETLGINERHHGGCQYARK